MPSSRASGSQSTPGSAGSPSCPVTTVTEVDTVRWVTGMPAAAGAANAELTPGHHLDVDTGPTQGLGLLAAAAEHERVPALQPHHPASGPGPVDEEVVDLGLQAGLPRALADVDPLGGRRGQVEQLGGDEPVVDDDLGAGRAVRHRAGSAGRGRRVRRRPGPRSRHHRRGPVATSRRPSPTRRGRVHRRCGGGTGPRPDRARRDGRQLGPRAGGRPGRPARRPFITRRPRKRPRSKLNRKRPTRLRTTPTASSYRRPPRPR